VLFGLRRNDQSQRTVTQILVQGKEARGVILEGGEEIMAAKRLVSSLHVQQVFPDMVPGFSLPADFHSERTPGQVRGPSAVPDSSRPHEDPKFKPGTTSRISLGGEIGIPMSKKFAQAFRDLEYALSTRDLCLLRRPPQVDPTQRIPAGKGALHLYAFQPYNLKDGGPKKWMKSASKCTTASIDDLRQITTNMSDDNYLGYHFLTPLDLERRNNAMKHADIGHIGLYSWQLGGIVRFQDGGSTRRLAKALICAARARIRGSGSPVDRDVMPGRHHGGFRMDLIEWLGLSRFEMKLMSKAGRNEMDIRSSDAREMYWW